jgi:HK97 family phage prohead protease
VTTNTFGFETKDDAHGFEVDAEARTIKGLAVPYGQPSYGDQYVFERGSLNIPDKASRVKLLISHDRTQAVGRATAFEETDDGLYATFSVARGTEGDRALALAEDGVLDGLSIGTRGGTFSRKGKHRVGSDHALFEVSLTSDPAFGEARVTSVTAEVNDNEGNVIVTDTQNQASSGEATFSAAEVARLVAEQMQSQSREVVRAGEATFETEADETYRFNRGGNRFIGGGKHDFSRDLFASLRGNDEAHERIMQFMVHQFDVDQADVSTLNPVPTRPELYVDQRAYQYPLWQSVYRGSLSDNTPFIVPKFNSASGLVAAHTEAVEPTPGSFTATSQTITPGAISGKVEITREVIDAGGSPQVSNLIWAKIVRAWNEALEAKVVTTLNAAAASITDIALTTAGTNDSLVSELGAAFADLQYVRGGFQFEHLALQIDLYKRLVGAKDSTGRPIFPIYNPTNANGSFSSKFSRINAFGMDGFPAWALAATSNNSANSWLYDNDSVHGWASAPQRFDWNFGATVQSGNIAQLAEVTIGVWGYAACAITDTAGVRQITYDPTA